MNRHQQTYGWLLLLTFVLGGLVAPALHFSQHTDQEHDPAAANDALVQAVSVVDQADCVLCDATLFATSLTVSVEEAVTYFDTVLQRAPQRPALDLIGNTLNRGPPVFARG